MAKRATQKEVFYMAKDPYQDEMPSREEMEASGASDWFADTLAQQKRQNARLKSTLGQDTSSIKARKKELESLLGDLPPDFDPEEPAPDLFATERDAARKERSSLSSLVGELEGSRAGERDMLKNLFGK